MAMNVLGTELQSCSCDPMTGYFRNGCCDTDGSDKGMHTVCVIVTAKFLEFSRAAGNDLSTPHEEFDFPGLKAGDRWCLCLSRWVEAYQAGSAPKVVLEATHVSVLEFLDLELLQQFAVTAQK